jgi:diaminohydroxyphosphoribosylaminopyrimidine deaminase / 5-amino-6-(5-phosphoribosylamino)uracil reductase
MMEEPPSVPPGEEDADASFMRRALELAGEGWGRTAPNPMVGAVIVQEGRIVGEGWHREYGFPHAEVEALRAAGDHARGATMYVTLEPCAHQGKTPPCTQAVIDAGISRVVFACHDPNPKARGGEEVLREAGIETRAEVLEEPARSLNAAFFHAHDPAAPRRPWTELKLALSLDGRVADHTGRSSWITGEEARAEVHRLRAGFDAIGVGIGTALSDDPLLTVRGPLLPRTPPVRVVFDRKLRTLPTSRLARSAEASPVWVIASADAPTSNRRALERAGVTVLEADGLADAFAVLADRGIRSLFCEGGARFASAVLQADLVDRLSLFYAPLLLGAKGADPFRDLPSSALAETHRWTRRRTRVFGGDTLISVDR